MAKDQRIRSITVQKQTGRCRWQGFCLSLFGFLLGLLFVTSIVTQVAWIKHLNTYANETLGGASGKEAMLNNFAKADGAASMKRHHEKNSDKKTIHKQGKDKTTTNHKSEERRAENNIKQQSSPAHNRGKDSITDEIIDEAKSHESQPQEPSPIDKLIDRSHRIEVPDQHRTLAFVHIGKSGGSTISLLLRNGCMTSADGTKPCEEDRWRKVPGQIEETIASRRILFYLHTPHVDSGKMAEYYRRVTSVVVVARDPLDRFVSAYLSRHPRNVDAMRLRNNRARARAEARGVDPPIWAKPVYSVGGDAEKDQVHRAAYIACYPNIMEFAMCADPSPGQPREGKVYKTHISWVDNGLHGRDITFKCKEVCRGIVSGKSKYIHHLRFNYEAFLKYLPPETEVFVIRTKDLWQDWIDVNRLLGSKRNVYIPDEGSDGDKVNVGSNNLPVRNNLRPKGRKILCQFLTNEIQIYIALLNRSVNLSDNDVRAALEGVQKNCPGVVKYLGADTSDAHRMV